MFVDSIENYLLLYQYDLILKIYLEINPLSYDFFNCLNCKDDELKYLNLELMKKTFFKSIDKTDCTNLVKSYKYLIEVNSVENLYDCKLIH
jgi:hypothetical protein